MPSVRNRTNKLLRKLLRKNKYEHFRLKLYFTICCLSVPGCIRNEKVFSRCRSSRVTSDLRAGFREMAVVLELP